MRTSRCFRCHSWDTDTGINGTCQDRGLQREAGNSELCIPFSRARLSHPAVSRAGLWCRAGRSLRVVLSGSDSLGRCRSPATSRRTPGPGTSTAPRPACPGSTASRAACSPAWSRLRWPRPPPPSRAWPTTSPPTRRSATSPPPPSSRLSGKKWPSWPRSKRICLSSRSNTVLRAVFVSRRLG